MWTEQDVHIERIYQDEAFWEENTVRVKHFFVTSVLPELVGKFYSQTSDSLSVPQVQSPVGLHVHQLSIYPHH